MTTDANILSSVVSGHVSESVTGWVVLSTVVVLAVIAVVYWIGALAEVTAGTPFAAEPNFAPSTELMRLGLVGPRRISVYSQRSERQCDMATEIAALSLRENNNLGNIGFSARLTRLHRAAAQACYAGRLA